MSVRVEHSCERCGKKRMVLKHKLDQGKLRVCRECNGKVTAEKRKEHSENGDVRERHYAICKQCGSEFWYTSEQQGQYCSFTCQTKAELKRTPMQDIISMFLKRKPTGFSPA